MAQFDHEGLFDHFSALAVSVKRNESSEALFRAALAAGEGTETDAGALAVTTGAFTGRSPKDKYIVRDALTEDRVWWDNSAPISQHEFDLLLADCLAASAEHDLNVQELFAGADAQHGYSVRVITETAWHALFIRHLLIRPKPGEKDEGREKVTIIHMPSFVADPARHGTRSGTAIMLDMSRNLVLIVGTQYAGEIKKSVFSLFNFHAPLRGVLPMHCSANVGKDGDVALFFGLSGTGKTTLSTDPFRPLIGDDEHGWSSEGVFNLEGGCYAKTAKLNARAEPEIFAAANRPMTVLENVALDLGRRPDFDDLSLTENTRAAYPIEALQHVVRDGRAGTPKTVVFLTADAFGVLPPIARLTPEQAVYHFLSGYTAKVAGTERGVTEPQATFSACFGAPFMSQHPATYGELLRQFLAESGASTWLINTGWTGGAYGTGRRIDIAATRRLVRAALSGELDNTAMRTDPVFGFGVPLMVEDIDPALLEPRRTWADPAAYDAAADKLVGMFIRNFGKFGALALSADGPRALDAAE